MRLPFLPRDTAVHDLLDAAAANATHTARTLRDLLAEWPEGEALLDAMTDAEHEGDRLTHELIRRLRREGPGDAPFDVADGHALASALDDVVDHAEQAADFLALYKIEAPMEQALGMADVLVEAAGQLEVAMACLREGEPCDEALVEVHRLENEGDRLLRAALASLFDGGIDPMVVIRWKDVFASLEASVDACEHVAHVLEGIALKNGG